jgi:hypothetical protein
LRNTALGYAIINVQGNQGGLESNGRYQLLVCAGDVTMLSENTNIVKKNREALLEVSWKVSIETNTEKTKYMVCLANIVQGKIIIY